MTETPIVDIACLKHTYPGGVRVDVCGIEFRVGRGERVAVLGPNGSGKSTLLKHILGVLKPSAGTVAVFGHDPARAYAAIRTRIGALLQNADEQLIGPTVFDDVAFAPLNFGFTRQETINRVEAILHALGIEHLRDRLPHYLSGGERKKVALAGALVTAPELLVMDEPLAGIDNASRRDIIAFLKRLHAETGMTMISTMHDMDAVSEMADMGYVMRTGGKLERCGAIIDLFYQYDLREFNLEPPAVVQLVKALHAQGYDVPPTLQLDTFTRDLLQRMDKNDRHRT